MRSGEQARSDKLDLEWLTSVLKSAQERAFYGVLELKMENGTLRRVESTTSLIPPHAVRGAPA